MAVTTALFAAAERGEYQMVVDEEFPFDQAVRAHQKMEDGGVVGRIVLTPS